MGRLMKSKEKKAERRKGGKSLGIRWKMNLCILMTLAVFIALIVGVIVKSSQYSRQYEQILDNISKITYIKTNSVKLSHTVVNMCGVGADIASSGHGEIAASIEAYVEEIGANIPQEAEYSEIRNQYDKFASEAGRYAESYREVLTACGDQYSSAGLGPAQTMDSNATFLNTSAEILLSSEISRSEQVEASIAQDFRKMLVVSAVIVVVVSVVVLAAAVGLSHSITAPIIQLQKQLTIMSQGDLTHEDMRVASGDEAGRAAEAFNTMKRNLVRLIGKVMEGTNELKTATSTVNISVDENAQGSARIAEAVEGMLSTLEQQRGEVNRTVGQIGEMEEISRKAADYAEAIHGNAVRTKDNAKDGMYKIVAYVEQMEEVNRSMREMESVFASFGDNTKGMTEALEAISSIASQTNLLSLNASIEAARAGEAGKGFAVVATEIRNLADDSQEAATRIGKMIESVNRQAESMSARLKDSLQQLEKGNQMTSEARESFDVIQRGTDEVSTSVEDIMQGMETLVKRISEATGSMEAVRETADQNVTEINEISAIVTEESANLEEVAEAMDKLLALTGGLDDLVAEFKVG